MKVVKIRHFNNDGVYLFKTAEDLKEGNMVMVNTVHGTQPGTVVEDSIDIPEEAVKYIVSCYHNNANLREVTGKFVEYTKFNSEVKE